MKQKLLVLTSTFPRWQNDQIPGFVYELSKRLVDEFEVNVLAPYSEGAKPLEVREGMKIRRFRYWPGRKDYLTGTAIVPSLKRNPLLWFLVPLFLFSQFLDLVVLIRRESIGIVHAHWVLPQGLLAILYKRFFDRRLRVVITSHGTDIYGLGRLDLLKRYAIKNCSAMTVVSNAIGEEVKKMGCTDSVPLEVIPMGVDFALFHPDKFDRTIREKYDIKGSFLLFVGRLSEKKGVNYLIGAMPEIVRQYPETRLLVVGYGEEKERLEALAESLGLLGKSIIFIGGLPNQELPSYYATADLLIGPSLTEGFGLVYVEAMGSGCGVIATDLPAIADIVAHRKTGLIVEQKNSGQISNAVIDLLENPDMRERLRNEGRRFVLDRYDWDTIAERYRALLSNEKPA